jgi:hypothetical protein
MVGEGCLALNTFHIIKHDPSCLKVTAKVHLLHQITSTTISIHRHLEHEPFFFGFSSWKTIILNVIITTRDLKSHNVKYIPFVT